MATAKPLAPLPVDAILPYLFAGNATFTVLNTLTSGRFTYRVRVAKDKVTKKPLPTGPWFVQVLTGSNNEGDYSYLGAIFPVQPGEDLTLKLTAKSAYGPDAGSVKAFAWTLKRLQATTLPPTIEVWHEGHCGRCGKLLTVPASIERGIGPDCAALMGLTL